MFGLAAGFSFRAADGALSRAGANTDQLIRVQAIQNKVVQADADATNAFLVGGLEPPAERAEYTAAITSASKLIAEAAENQPADGPALGALNEALLTYASEIEQARANNRQALPIGAQYLKNASAGLRADALPPLQSLVKANDQRVEEEFDNAQGAALWLVIFGLLALLALGFALIWLARRTRRYVNVPLAAAAAIVLVTLVAGAVGLGGHRQQGRRRTGRGLRGHAVHGTGPDRRVRRQVEREPVAHCPRFRGSLRGRRGRARMPSSSASSPSWRTTTRPAELEPLPWDDYASVHEQIRKLDDSGNWDGAVRLATGTGSSSGNATFASFDTSSGEQLSTLGEDTASQLDEAGGWLPFAAVLGLVAGVVAALCAWWGVSLRLEEYR